MKNQADRVEGLIKRRVELNYYEQQAGGPLAGRRFVPLQLPDATRGTGHDFLRDDWSLAELLAYHDRDFVRNAYLVLLKRDADVEGLNDRVQKLRSNQVSRVETLFRLRYGPEGKQHGTRVRGLLRTFLVEKICAIPVVGLVPRYLVALVRLPCLLREYEELRGIVAMHRNESQERDRAIADFVNSEFGGRSAHFSDEEGLNR